MIEAYAPSITLTPLLNRCGHKTRFVIDPGTWIEFVGYSKQILTSAGTPDWGEFQLAVSFDMAESGVDFKIQLQIDLTDDGGWTDIGWEFLLLGQTA